MIPLAIIIIVLYHSLLDWYVHHRAKKDPSWLDYPKFSHGMLIIPTTVWAIVKTIRKY